MIACELSRFSGSAQILAPVPTLHPLIDRPIYASICMRTFVWSTIVLDACVIAGCYNVSCPPFVLSSPSGLKRPKKEEQKKR